MILIKKFLKYSLEQEDTIINIFHHTKHYLLRYALRKSGAKVIKKLRIENWEFRIFAGAIRLIPNFVRIQS